MLYEHLVRKIVRGQRLDSEALSPEIENVLHRNIDNVNCRKNTPVSFRYCASYCEENGTAAYLGELENCEKRLSASSRLSVLLHGTIRHPLNEFSRILILTYFSKICRENSTFITILKNNAYFTSNCVRFR